MKIAAAFAGFLAFLILASANAAGYRYGVSDQAAYVPAVMIAEHPASFPRDAPLIRTQGGFFIVDDILGGLGRLTGASLEWRFLSAYLIAMATIWIGILLVGSRLYTSVWVLVAFAALLTLRHHIPRTSVNSLEPYFHPRLLAFGLGIIAVAAFRAGRSWLAVALVGVAALGHATTALWFTVLIGTALLVADRRWRLPGAIVLAAALAALAWLMVAGTRMDPLWVEALDARNFIFANGWPLWAWAANMGLLGALWLAHLVRRRRGTATREDAALVWGATALVGVFVVTLPAVAAHVALAVQFQFSRVFWIVDLLVAMYGLAAIGESLRARQAMALALLLAGFSVTRAVYVMTREHAERNLFEVSLPESPWLDAMRWLGRQPLDAHVLADPGHAFKYGASVRVAAGRDVLLEDDKDAAVAMYSRPIAERVVERRHALANFTGLTAAEARALAERYDLNYLVTEATLPLPEVYRNARFRIYALKPAGPAS